MSGGRDGGGEGDKDDVIQIQWTGYITVGLLVVVVGEWLRT